MDKNVKVGFIGLGRMGYPMASRLASAGVQLTVLDEHDEVATRFATETGACATQSLPQLAEKCDVVILMLPNGRIVRDVVLGPRDGNSSLIHGARRGLIIIDMSSSAPTGTRELGDRLDAQGVELLDAPVSGGVKGARSGKLAVMVGGRRQTIDRWRPLIELMGSRLFIVGPLGSGHAAKALNNYVSAAGLAAAAEALRIGERFGVTGTAMVDVLNASSGRNNSTENKFKQYILSGTFDSGFALGLMAKDLTTAHDLASETGTFAPLIGPCDDVWQAATKKLGPDCDHTAYYRYLSG